ncbi:MAG: hypothetical protein V2B18_06375 [Pseudomonadota bacterium]
MERRKINTRDILADIRAGLGDIPIMEKHNLTPAQLGAILKRLEEAKAIQSVDLEWHAAHKPKPADWRQKRATRRNYLFLTMSICDAGTNGECGLLNDITEKGLQVMGINVKPGEKVDFLLRSAELTVDTPFVFQALCRWVSRDHVTKQPIAGFEITSISPEARVELRKVIIMLTLQDSG